MAIKYEFTPEGRREVQYESKLEKAKKDIQTASTLDQKIDVILTYLGLK